ncbi:hypothetical protein D8B26_000745 [Coccidioides posadasii str. Silveira]|uniref:Uncharacterized protein n=3 Tax=Coccidioides posadasii TaxID=199306 RepID=E9CSE2_COCPS|nr:hypothetical protein CPC735_037110 [Coccidioides posadasii C735 delta SOWgp]EER29005.1 hypothetical protein CPC735_037110 [Coccidioides posadasii C735 delta SOWgp]EFW22602.1 conserved hypothetical protein [Coccidioides posadasii str. Silveira]KMM63859.1 hypothetical protein CPAG_00212 [Coccidioides posadasii RMSCC 3488]QVM06033.1 hypothetical protein D8B26_000745 [Coccidioides posadasii str. Silveira]|eukprot:XP_003071150.1 hypothetical protein CPC735_037110 [Coccidioides posadasii C735 delta SOWgp]
MGSSLSVVKTLFVPALISLGLYILLFYAVIPFVRRYRQRYAQYLPLHTISAHTSSLRDRASDALMRFVLPSSWRRQFVEGQDDSGSVLDEEGEGMVGFEMDAARRAALERQRDDPMGTEGRLSRELEEGFMDDSDDEVGDDRGATQRTR